VTKGPGVGPCRKLRSWEGIRAGVRDGLRAVTSARHALFERPAAYSCSVDLDATLREAEPNAPRWDYVAARRDGTTVGVEVHPAKASEVDTVIAKKRWAEQRLLSHCVLRVDRWYWVRPARSRLQFTPLSPKARLLAMSGVRFPVARVP
jgi:hypothetical protein